MSQQPPDQARADYGIDAPGVVRSQVIIGIAGVILGPALYLALRVKRPVLAAFLLNIELWFGIGSLVAAAVMLWSSKIGKLRQRDRMIDAIPWHGDESVLDVGCGRGMLLIAAARHLTSGRAIGVDIWRDVDQSGNRPETTRTNARAEGVVDRIEITNGDARMLPFRAATFDVVVSSLVIHNIGSAEGRRQAVSEMARVLQPGGQILILDLLHTGDYARVLRESGLVDVRRSRPIFLFFSVFTRLVIARKPAVAGSLASDETRQVPETSRV